MGMHRGMPLKSRQKRRAEPFEPVESGIAEDGVSAGPLVAIVSPVAVRQRAWADALHGCFQTVGVARIGELRQTVSRSRPAVLLLDASAGGVIEPSAIPGLQRLYRHSAILAAIDRPEMPVELSLVLSGVRGCCSTGIDAALLRKAVASVSRGGYWVRRTVLEAVVKNVVSVTDSREEDTLARDFSRMLNLLTPRQLEIVRLVGGGGSNKEIANRLRLSEKTVKAHLTSAFQKLGISDRLRLALLVNQPSPSYVSLPLTQAARDPKRLSYWVRR